MKSHDHITKTLFSITGLIILAKLVGFVKQMVVAGLFGTTLETDLINLSQGFIGNIQYVLVQTLVTSFVSVYIYTKQNSEEKAQTFTISAVKAFTLITAGVAVLVFLGAPWLARFIAPSYSVESTAALSSYLRLFSPALILFVWIAAFQALLNANKHFIPGEMVGLNQSLIIIGIVVLFHKQMGVSTLVVSFFLYTVWNVLFLSFQSRGYWRLSRGNPFAEQSVRELLRMTLPLLLGYSLVYVNQMVDKILSSGLGAGAVTSLEYGAVLSNLIGTFIGSFSSIFFSYVTTRISSGEHKSAAYLANQTTLLLTIVFLPISILTVVCSQDIVTIAFGRGAFNADSIRMTSAALAGYGFSFVPLAFREVYSRFQYGYKNSRQPMINSSIGIVANIVLSILLCPRYGVLGVTFASSVSVALCGALNMLFARRHNSSLRLRDLLRQLPLVGVGAVVCGLIGFGGCHALESQTPLVRFAITTVCALTGYLAVTAPLLLRIKKEGIFQKRIKQQ